MLFVPFFSKLAAIISLQSVRPEGGGSLNKEAGTGLLFSASFANWNMFRRLNNVTLFV